DPRAIKHGAGRQRFRETLRELRDEDYDAVIDLQGLLKSAMLARSVRGRRTIGFPRKHLREKLARLFYTDAPDPGDATHVIYKNLALLAPLKVADRRLRFPRPSTARAARSEEHKSELQSRGHLVCRLLLKKKTTKKNIHKRTRR